MPQKEPNQHSLLVSNWETTQIVQRRLNLVKDLQKCETLQEVLKICDRCGYASKDNVVTTETESRRAKFRRLDNLGLGEEIIKYKVRRWEKKIQIEVRQLVADYQAMSSNILHCMFKRNEVLMFEVIDFLVTAIDTIKHTLESVQEDPNGPECDIYPLLKTKYLVRLVSDAICQFSRVEVRDTAYWYFERVGNRITWYRRTGAPRHVCDIPVPERQGLLLSRRS